MEEVEHRFVRTARHPAAELVQGRALDSHYEQADTFEVVYQAIADEVSDAARQYGRVLYAVPGSPRVAEQTVELLSRIEDIDVVVHPALSFLDLSWVALGIDPIDSGVRIIDGHRFATEAAGSAGPLLVAQCHSQQILSDIKLAIDEPDDMHVTVLQRLGAPDQQVFDVAWADLDREVDADHLTSLYIASLPTPVSTAFARFDVLVRRLRQDCPWDAEQTHASLRRYLLEESYETLEALDHLDAATNSADEDTDVAAQRFADLQEELGDLLYQIFFHSILATEEGWFDVAQVAEGIHDKLYERHPHVFDGEQLGLDELSTRWEESKREEKGRASVMDGIPTALPALLYAIKVQKKALAIGESIGTLTKSGALTARTEAEVGSLLFSVVALAREIGVDAESALRQHAVALADSVRAPGK
jgi:tetrapyrrole methylase family protein/MazG family protein